MNTSDFRPDDLLHFRWKPSLNARLQEVERRSQGDVHSLTDIDFAVLVILQARSAGAPMTANTVVDAIGLRCPVGGWSSFDRSKWLETVEQAIKEICS